MIHGIDHFKKKKKKKGRAGERGSTIRVESNVGEKDLEARPNMGMISCGGQGG